MREWVSLYESKSGERGIFNRESAKKQAAKNGRLDTEHDFGCNPCSEIILRPYQFCNLSEVVARAGDTEHTLATKVGLATILGTFQSTMTNFKYIRKIWQKNTEEERLLGVSLTGIMDNEMLSGNSATLGMNIGSTLELLRDVAVQTNKGMAKKLVDSASGIHARHNPHYIRTVRGDNKDPLTQFLISEGIPAEPDVMKPDSTTVFSFPMKSPNAAVTRTEMTAIEQLDLWLLYQRHWCEHKPSVTISVKENEWMSVGSWVYEHFDEVSGISFLPFSDHTYAQAPYQDCTKDEYKEMLAKMPKAVNWNKLSDYEKEDTTSGGRELACTAGVCEVVDLTAA